MIPRVGPSSSAAVAAGGFNKLGGLTALTAINPAGWTITADTVTRDGTGVLDTTNAGGINSLVLVVNDPTGTFFAGECEALIRMGATVDTDDLGYGVGFVDSLTSPTAWCLRALYRVTASNERIIDLSYILADEEKSASSPNRDRLFAHMHTGERVFYVRYDIGATIETFATRAPGSYFDAAGLVLYPALFFLDRAGTIDGASLTVDLAEYEIRSNAVD